MATLLVIVLIVLAVAGVFAIAAGAIGREARRLDAVAPRAVYDLEEALVYVADRIPPETQAHLTPDELRELLRMHMTQLRQKGLQPPRAVDHVQDIDEPVVVEETSAVGYLIGRAEAAGIELTDTDVVFVVEAHLGYFAAIGAVGPLAADPEVDVRRFLAEEPPPGDGTAGG
jgi:hypothetical protein